MKAKDSNKAPRCRGAQGSGGEIGTATDAKMQSEARQNKCQNARQQNDARDASDLGLAAMQGNSEVLTKGRVVCCEEDARGDCMGEFGWEICMGEEEGRESLFTMGGPGGQRASDCVGATVCVLKVVNVGSVGACVCVCGGTRLATHMLEWTLTDLTQSPESR